MRESYNYDPMMRYTQEYYINLVLYKDRPYYIKYIDEPSEEVQLKAIYADYRNYQYINNPSDQVTQKYIEMKLAS